MKKIKYFADFIDKYEFEYLIIYSRKSRGDNDKDVLASHRRILTDIVEELRCTPVWFEEIDSSEDENREKFNLMMDYIKEKDMNKHGLLVVDIDRIGRNFGTGILYDLLQKEKVPLLEFDSDTIYDFNLDDHMNIFELKNMVARMEQRKNKARGRRRRVDAINNGEFSMQGKSPFPYEFDKVEKGLIYQEENKKIYLEIVEKFLNKVSYADLARELNDLGIPSPRDKKWSDKPVKYFLTSEIHRGFKIIKGEGSFKKGTWKELPKEKWTIMEKEKCKWEALIDEATFERIMRELLRRSTTNKKSNNSIHSLSGLLVCGVCNKNLHLFLNNNGFLSTRACNHDGEKCGNKGGKVGMIEKACIEIMERLIENDDKEGLQATVDHKIKQREKKITTLKKEIISMKEDIKEKLNLMQKQKQFHLTDEDVEALGKERMELINEIENHEQVIKTFLVEIDELELEKNKSSKEILSNAINELKMDSRSEKKNKIFKQFFQAIYWHKTENEIKFTVELI